ncbi:hypothetical protein [Bacillus cereus]
MKELTIKRFYEKRTNKRKEEIKIDNNLIKETYAEVFLPCNINETIDIEGNKYIFVEAERAIDGSELLKGLEYESYIDSITIKHP